MYMYSQKQIAKASKLGAMLEPVMVKDLKKWDLVFYDNRVSEDGDWMHFIRWTYTTECHCHIDIKYTERRLKHLAQVVDKKTGRTFHDTSLGHVWAMGTIHGQHKLASMRYAGDDISKYPTRKHVVHTNFDEEGDPMTTSFYRDDIVFVLRNTLNDISCRTVIDGQTEREYLEDYFCRNLTDPNVFHRYVLTDIEKPCHYCEERDIVNYEMRHKEKGYFGLIDWNYIWNEKIRRYKVSLDSIDALVKHQDYSQETWSFQNEYCSDLYYRLKDMLNEVDVERLGLNKPKKEVYTYKVMLEMLDVYYLRKKNFNKLQKKFWKTNKINIDDWYDFYYDGNVKRKSRKVVSY